MDVEVVPESVTFGSVLGFAPGNVPSYSCDYDTADDTKLPNRQAYRSYLDGVYMGYKWQCVEFARRWLYVNRGYVFDDIAMAYDIFQLRSVLVISDGSRLPLRSFRNGAKRPPEPGALLIWDEGGDFETTGHVAVITEATPTYVRVAEQNFRNSLWPQGQSYSRQLNAKVAESGEYWIECASNDSTILGWVSQTSNDIHAEPQIDVDPRLFNIQAREVSRRHNQPLTWLNIANPDEAAYVHMMGGPKLSSKPEDEFKYYCISKTAHAELKRATNELHALFMHATDYVLRDDARLARFNIPRCLWEKIHRSWDNRRNQMITGRFDFSLSERGLKVYEYNCDSASTHMECGKVQGKWAKYYGCDDDGVDAGAKLHERLRAAWKESDVDGILHIMQDRDLEESYHALFMQEALEAAGIATKIIHGVDGLSWSKQHDILDSDGVPIKWVWKTWAWETALDQIRAECEDDEERLARYRPGQEHTGPPRLVDVLLRQDVMVYEPLWTLIPSNKAILPILSSLFPTHPYLLRTTYALTDDLVAKGYVAKPIVGRGGSNISIYDRGERLLKETQGKFENRDQIYQELFKLPFAGGYNAQISTFSAGGKYAGAGIRVDRSLVINMDSDNLALRILDDDEIVETP